jgi:hypothetical protein
MTGRTDDAAGVRMSGKDNRSFGSVDGSDDRVHVVVERSQRDGRSRDRDPGLLQLSDDFAPARPVGPCSMDENDSGWR